MYSYLAVYIVKCIVIESALIKNADRWSRMSRENRKCPCGEFVEDEENVIFVCGKTAHIRNKYGIIETSLSDFFSGRILYISLK